MKTKRHLKILEIIERKDIETQEELCACLNEEGVKTTQATVSRDIRELKLTKVPTAGGKQKYAQLREEKAAMRDKFDRIFREGTVKLETAQNILVIKTVSGMAMAVAAALDEMDWPQIVGSIAGDDTIMCAVRSSEEAEDLLRLLRKVMR